MVTAKSLPPLAPGEVRAYPVLPFRDIVVFPHMIVPLFVGREKSVRALEKVTQSDTSILLATQKKITLRGRVWPIDGVKESCSPPCAGESRRC
jgi:hypothetical protein